MRAFLHEKTVVEKTTSRGSNFSLDVMKVVKAMVDLELIL